MHGFKWPINSARIVKVGRLQLEMLIKLTTARLALVLQNQQREREQDNEQQQVPREGQPALESPPQNADSSQEQRGSGISEEQLIKIHEQIDHCLDCVHSELLDSSLEVANQSIKVGPNMSAMPEIMAAEFPEEDSVAAPAPAPAPAPVGIDDHAKPFFYLAEKFRVGAGRWYWRTSTAWVAFEREKSDAIDAAYLKWVDANSTPEEAETTGARTPKGGTTDSDDTESVVSNAGPATVTKSGADDVTAAEDRFDLDSRYYLDFRSLLQKRTDVLPDGSRVTRTRECKRERVGIDPVDDFRAVQKDEGYFD